MLNQVNFMSNKLFLLVKDKILKNKIKIPHNR